MLSIICMQTNSMQTNSLRSEATLRAAEDERTGRSHWPLGILGVVAIVAAPLVAMILAGVSEQHDVRQLDPATRAALVGRTSADLRSACDREAPTAPWSWCRNQAEFVLLFEECNADCQAVAREVLRVAPR